MKPQHNGRPALRRALTQLNRTLARPVGAMVLMLSAAGGAHAQPLAPGSSPFVTPAPQLLPSPSPASPPTPGRAPARPAPANYLVEAARTVGVRQCLGAVTRLASLAVNGATAHDVVLDWDRVAPDAGAFFGLVGAAYGDPVVLTTVTVLPEAQGRCTVLAERITAAPASCQSVAERELQGYVGAPLLPHMTVYTAAQDVGAAVVLVDAPPSCLVIRRHVQYRWEEPPAAPTATGRPGRPLER